MTESRIDPTIPTPVSVTRVHRETHDTVTLDLDVSDRPGGFAFQPGQFNMLYAFGIGEVPISISGDPGEPRRLVHTIRAVGATTTAIVASAPGASVGVRGPYGSGWPVDAAEGRDVVIVAGGLGIAPLRPVLYRIAGARDRFGRVSLLYGARTPDDLLYTDELARWRDAMDVQLVVDRADSGWPGAVGVVPSLLGRTVFDPRTAVALLCGPEVMMCFTVRELLSVGMPSSRVFVSLERNMKCAIGFCGHCQYGPSFVCKDGPVYAFDHIEWLFARREI